MGPAELLAVGLRQLDLRGVVLLLVLALRVRRLDEPAGRRVVARDRHLQHAPVVELELLLHEALAERAAADDEGAVVVLERASHDLARARGVLVDEHDHRLVLERAACAGAVLAVEVAAAAAGVDDHLVLGEELVGDADRHLHQAAGVVAEVEDEAFHALRFEAAERRHELVVARPGEALELDVARRLVDHVAAMTVLSGISSRVMVNVSGRS